jgi:hypothetical protein
MPKSLFVSALHEWELVMVFIKCLAEACHVSVSKYSKGCWDKALSAQI